MGDELRPVFPVTRESVGSTSWVEVSSIKSETTQVPETAVLSKCNGPERSRIMVGLPMIKSDETLKNRPSRGHFCPMRDSFIIIGKTSPELIIGLILNVIMYLKGDL